MAAPRSSTPRGSRVLGRPGSGGPDPAREPLPEPEPVDDPTAPRQVVDYALQRRAALESLFRGGALDSDHCDADPYLVRAARHHGEPAADDCPVCHRSDLTYVTYVYGDELGHLNGRVRSTEELDEMAHQHGAFRVYVVEVCPDCGWNHLSISYVLGDGTPRRPPPRPRDLLD
ncbi:MAG: DUF5318 family protein [Candidatus Nanopelagicales bacterium]